MDRDSFKMQKEKTFFLQVLADYLDKRKTKVPEGLDWRVLDIIGQTQQLTGILYHQCRNDAVFSELPAEISTHWKHTYLYNFHLYTKRLKLLKQIGEEFQKENVPYLIFKGTEVATFYPVPAQRTMYDSDLLVHEEDKQKAGNVLTRLGFTLDTSLPVEWFASKDGMEIELHHRLIYDYHSVEVKTLQNWGDRVWDYTVVQRDRVQHKIDLTYHLVFVLLHLRKHFLMEGVGFRHFMDVAVLASQPEVNWRQALLWLKELKLEKFSQVCFAFCKRWFGVSIPIAEAELREDFYNDTTERVFSGGFGVLAEESKENKVFNESRFNKTSGTYAVLKTILKRAFLPYSVMRDISYCKFLDGRPYLLPVAWLWRFLYIVCTGGLIPYFKGAYSRDTIKKKEERLSNWGL